MTARQKRLARKAKLERIKENSKKQLTEDEELDQAVEYMINALSEYISEETLIRAVSHHGFMYDVHEIPFDGDTWYLGITPEGSVIAIGLDEYDAIKQCEMYVVDQLANNEKTKNWDPDTYLPVPSYTLQ